MSALAHETPMIPVVFVYVADPIGFGFAASFAHSGGNMTGSAKLTEYCIDNPDDDLRRYRASKTDLLAELRQL